MFFTDFFILVFFFRKWIPNFLSTLSGLSGGCLPASLPSNAICIRRFSCTLFIYAGTKTFFFFSRTSRRLSLRTAVCSFLILTREDLLVIVQVYFHSIKNLIKTMTIKGKTGTVVSIMVPVTM